jgi:SAM-dependent methyltransferase
MSMPQRWPDADTRAQTTTLIDSGQHPCPAPADVINHDWYSRPRSVSAFSADDYLEPSLILILLRYRHAIENKPVLDIGVGAGRTTLYLSRFTSDYVGVDYSPAMVTHCRRRFPGVRIELCDASDLGCFRDGSFSFVLFTYCGIDAIGHDARLRALGEITRVLEPGGVCAFSAHNRAFADARSGPHIGFSRNPVTQAANVLRWVRRARNHARLRTFEFDGPEYAVVNDAAEEYSLLHYYITRDAQRRQLDEAGLGLVEMYDRWLNPVSELTDDSASPWIWYVARKDE